jgi:hypothetical protein
MLALPPLSPHQHQHGDGRPTSPWTPALGAALAPRSLPHRRPPARAKTERGQAALRAPAPSLDLPPIGCNGSQFRSLVIVWRRRGAGWLAGGRLRQAASRGRVAGSRQWLRQRSENGVVGLCSLCRSLHGRPGSVCCCCRAGRVEIAAARPLPRKRAPNAGATAVLVSPVARPWRGRHRPGAVSERAWLASERPAWPAGECGAGGHARQRARGWPTGRRARRESRPGAAARARRHRPALSRHVCATVGQRLGRFVQ